MRINFHNPKWLRKFYYLHHYSWKCIDWGICWTVKMPTDAAAAAAARMSLKKQQASTQFLMIILLLLSIQRQHHRFYFSIQPCHGGATHTKGQISHFNLASLATGQMGTEVTGCALELSDTRRDNLHQSLFVDIACRDCLWAKKRQSIFRSG